MSHYIINVESSTCMCRNFTQVATFIGRVHMDQLTPQPKLIHFGSLAEKEANRILTGGTSEEIKLGIKAGNINISNADTIALDPSQPTDNQKALLAEFERRKRARHMNLTTDDAEVRTYLRKLKKPICKYFCQPCLFGEGPGERRERLKQYLSVLGEDVLVRLKESVASATSSSLTSSKMDVPENETWYHEGPPTLRDCRLWIAQYSLPRARDRLELARANLSITETQRTAQKQKLHRTINSFGLLYTQIGDNRPLSSCNLNDDSSLIAVSSWSGLCKVWSTSKCELKHTLRGHITSVGSVIFYPGATWEETSTYGGSPNQTLALASCGHDGSVKLWNLSSEEAMADLEGHEPHRVSRLQFHPSGRFLGTCCFDTTWRLWDMEYREEILYQEGHSDAVFDISFHPDGSLAATGGFDTYGRVWDLRTGHCIMFMEDHLKPIYTIDWSPNGYQLITGSQDNTCKIWDIRQRKCLYTIPAHDNLISKAKFLRNSGDCILTASYDGTAKLWAHPGWMPIKTLKAQEGKIMGADISMDGKLLVTCGFDKTFKLWGPDDTLPL